MDKEVILMGLRPGDEIKLMVTRESGDPLTRLDPFRFVYTVGPFPEAERIAVVMNPDRIVR